MSKKIQQNKKVPQKYQDASNDYSYQDKKGQGKGKVTTLQETLEPNDADGTEFLTLLPNDYPIGNQDAQDNSVLILLGQKILADLKNLLIIPFKNFWATIKHNFYLQDALDLFLRYSPRQHLMSGEIPKGYNREYWIIVQEIYRCILWIYVRMVSFAQEDQAGNLYEAWGCAKILYDNWLIDIMKLTDIALIYGPNNKVIVQRIITNVFAVNKSYQDDFKSVLTQCYDKILDRIYTGISTLSNQSQQETQIFTEDVKQKMDVLTLTLDTIETLITWLRYFPQKQQLAIFQNIKAIGLIEQIYYEILMIRGFIRGEERFESIWRIERLPLNLTPLLNKILGKILDFFSDYFEFLLNLVLQVQDRGERSVVSQLNEHIQYLIHNLGLVRRKGTKPKKNQSENEIKEWYLVEGLYDRGFSLAEFFQNLVPWGVLNQVDKVEQQQLQDILTSVLEGRNFLKQIAQGLEIEQQQIQQIDIEDYDPEASELNQLEIKNEQQQTQDQEPALDYVQQNEENLVKIESKRNQKVTIELPQEKRNELAAMMANIYDDEPDDTYEYEAAKKGENNDESEDDYNKYNNRKILKRNDKHYDQSDQSYEQKQQRNVIQKPKQNYQEQQQNSNQYQQQDQNYQQKNQNQYTPKQQGQQYDDNRPQYQDKSRQHVQQQSNHNNDYQDQSRRDNKGTWRNENNQKSNGNDNRNNQSGNYKNNQTDYRSENNNQSRNESKNYEEQKYQPNQQYAPKHTNGDNQGNYKQDQQNTDESRTKVLQKPKAVARDGGYVENVYKVKDNQLNTNLPEEKEQPAVDQSINKSKPLKGYKQKKNHHDEGKGHRNRDNYAG